MLTLCLTLELYDLNTTERRAYFRQWLDYHIGLGVDHIFVYDSDGSAGEIAAAYSSRGVLSYFSHWASRFGAKVEAAARAVFPQITEQTVTAHCLSANRDRSDWVLLLHGLDEYLAGLRNIRAELMAVLQHTHDVMAAVHIPWRLFREDQDADSEDSSHIVIERYQLSQPRGDDRHSSYRQTAWGPRRYMAITSSLLVNPLNLLEVTGAHWGRGRPRSLHLDGGPPDGLFIAHFVDLFRKPGESSRCLDCSVRDTSLQWALDLVRGSAHGSSGTSASKNHDLRPPAAYLEDAVTSNLQSVR